MAMLMIVFFAYHDLTVSSSFVQLFRSVKAEMGAGAYWFPLCAELCSLRNTSNFHKQRKQKKRL